MNHANLHPYRLKLKQLRYVLELAAADERDEDWINVLKKAQDTIGEWHDWESLAAIGAEVLDHDGCGLLRQIKTNAQRSYDRALAVAHSLRRRYAAGSPAARRVSASSHGDKLRQLPPSTLAASLAPAA